MILKISTLDKGWVIYDNLNKVHYKPLKFKEAKLLNTDAMWLGKVNKNESNICVYILAKKTNKDGLDLGFSIVASDSVFLCNDEGKTIERIN